MPNKFTDKERQKFIAEYALPVQDIADGHEGDYFQTGGYTDDLIYPLATDDILDRGYIDGCSILDPTQANERPHLPSPIYPSGDGYEKELIAAHGFVASRFSGEWPIKLLSEVWPTAGPEHAPGDSNFDRARSAVVGIDRSGTSHANPIPAPFSAMGIESPASLASVVSMDTPDDFCRHMHNFIKANCLLREPHATPFASVYQEQMMPHYEMAQYILRIRQRVFSEKYTWGVNRLYNDPRIALHPMVWLHGMDNSHDHPSYPSGHTAFGCTPLCLDRRFLLSGQMRLYMVYCIVLFSYGRNIKGVHTVQDNNGSMAMCGLLHPYWLEGDNNMRDDWYRHMDEIGMMQMVASEEKM